MRPDQEGEGPEGHASWPDALHLAVGTLTVIPVPAPGAVTPRVAGRAMLLAPLAALPLALLTAAVLVLTDLALLPPFACAALALGALALATRGLHLDGLADTADGLASGYDRQRALEVMRQGDVGPAGLVTVVIVVLVQAACLASLLPSDAAAARASTAATVTVAVLLSRCVLPLACAAGVPSARPSGLGATVAGSVPRVVAAVPVVVLAGLGCLLLASVGLPWWRAAAAGLAAIVVTAAVVVRCTRRLGGITGDVLGAAVELSFTAALLPLTAG